MKNTSGAQDRGAHAETVVYEHFLDRGYRLCYHRKKIFGVEFDLVFINDDHRVYVEVKSVRSPAFYVKRWPWRQKQRFLRVAAVLAEREKAHFFLALVDYKDGVHLFKVGNEL